MEQKEKEKSAKEIKLDELLDQHHLTVYGSFTIPQLIKKFGQPKAILEYAKVEAKTGLTSSPTMVVERFVDGKLFFRKDLVIPNISKSMLLMMDYNGIQTVYVRHPTYSPSNMIKATDKEIQSQIKHNP